ncbi:MAG: class I SAM-dependent RNA methyltransferase, partial [Deltaproteobacteria bacterium]|nr:class I SAM-dependent RNA methyltransferase [Deltaproteobacteria bacterium]
FRGKWIGRLDGKVVFVPFALEGEILQAAKTREKKDYIEAKIVEVSNHSPHRISPFCRYYTVCGGCHFQHTPYENEIEYKKRVLKGMIGKAFGNSAPDIEAVRSEKEFFYRKRVRFKCREGKLGFFGFESRDFVAVDQCAIAREEINRSLKDLRVPRDGEIEIEGDDAGRTTAKDGTNMILDLSKISPGLTISYGKGNFIQVNRDVNIALISKVVEWLAGSEQILELYSGIGNFSLPLALNGHKMTCIELSRSSVETLRINAGRYGISIDTRVRDLNKTIDTGAATADSILLDPPRAGSKEGMRLINRLKPASVAYVSCDPATLIRDLKMLDGYEIEEIVLFDMFPRTYHFETAVKLSRRNNRRGVPGTVTGTQPGSSCDEFR